MNAMEFRFLLFLLLASTCSITVSGGLLKPESELTPHDQLETFPSDEEEDYVDNSAYDDDKYDEKEEIDQATQDAIDSCQNNLTEAKAKRGEPYICFEFRDKKQMTHYLVRPAGTTVKLFCNVKGNPTPSIRWLKNGVPFDKPNYLTKFGQFSLRLIDVGKNVGGKYTCKAVSPDATVKPITYDIRLDVPDRHGATPIIRSDLKNRTVETGAQLIIDCGFKSDHAALTTTFIFRTDVYTTEKEFLQLDMEGNLAEAKSRTDDEDLLHDPTILAIDNVTFSDEGWYSCIVGNSVGRSFTSAYISVVEEIPKDDILKSNPIHGDLHRYQIAFVIIAGILFLLLVIAFVFCMYSKKQERLRRIETKNRSGGWTKQVIIERRPVSDDEGAILIPDVNIKTVESSISGQEYDFPIDWSWEFPRNQLTLGDKLGEGAFGEVLLGKAQEIVPGQGTLTVAVKSLKKTHTDAELIDLITELETMKLLGQNTNIINLLGCCSQGGDLLIIMEFCEKGNLRDYLRFNKTNYYYYGPPPSDMVGPLKEGQEVLVFKDLMSFAFQVARGMEYLVQRKYVHRDLAARNILVTGSGSGKIVKIADFGMTRSTFTNDYYRKKTDGRVPVRWMAPETLFHRIYTTHSDVWSYGILLYEIVTLGGTPYPTMPDVNLLLDFLRVGNRMNQPNDCPLEVYMLMLNCWYHEPAARPQFSELAAEMERILHIAAKVAKAEYMDMELIDDYQVDPATYIETPETTPENSDGGVIIFDPSLWVD